MLTHSVQYVNDSESPIKMAILEEDIYEATYKASIDPEINLTDDKKTEYEYVWRINRERTSKIEKEWYIYGGVTTAKNFMLIITCV